MKEVPQIYSDGIAESFFTDDNYFAGYNLDELVASTLVGFARMQLEQRGAVPYDHRLINAHDNQRLTNGLVVRYIELRGIHHISFTLTPDGNLDAQIGWTKDKSA